jgi:hypothetical protein
MRIRNHNTVVRYCTGTEFFSLIRTAKGGADIVKGAACKSCDMAHTAVHKSGAMAKSAVAVAERAAEVPGRVVEKIKEHWRVHHFDKLPGWMRDNEYLR